MRILIIGSGFVGGHLIDCLYEQGHALYVLSRRPIFSEKIIQAYTGSICDMAHVQDAVTAVQPDIVYHLAAEKARGQTAESMQLALEVNLMGSFNILKACLALKSLRAIVVMGSAEEYGDSARVPFQEGCRERPITAYSLSKTCLTYLCELMHRTFNLPVVLLRPSLIYGPGQGAEMFLPALIRKLLDDDIFEMTAGEQERDFVYIDDVIRMMVRLIDSPQAIGEIINVGQGCSIRIGDLAKRVAKKLDKQSFLHLGKLPYRKNEIFNYSMSIAKAKLLLDWEPKISLEQGLDQTLSYFQGART